MNPAGLCVAVTGAARGAQIFLSARDLAAAGLVADAISRRGPGRADAFHCDLAVPTSVRAFAAALAERTGHLDVLINDGAPYVEGDDLGDVPDDGCAPGR